MVYYIGVKKTKTSCNQNECENTKRIEVSECRIDGETYEHVKTKQQDNVLY
jgi:hypothetical protein